jgi:hypothetical protein
MICQLMTALLSLSTPAHAGGTVVVSNQSSYEIHNLFLSSSSSPSWEDDKLGQTVLTRGGTFALGGIGCDTYDVKLVDEDGDVCEVKGVPLCEGTETWVIDDSTLIGCQMQTMGSAPAPAAMLQMVNYSDWTITQLYLSSSSSPNWGPDQLGSTVVSSGGGSFALGGIACDTYDVKLVDEDSDECILKGVPLCGGQEQWTVTSEDLLACQMASQ